MDPVETNLSLIVSPTFQVVQMVIESMEMVHLIARADIIIPNSGIELRGVLFLHQSCPRPLRIIGNKF